jgi:glycosyltransferase involved in cell wall biosynthesis
LPEIAGDAALMFKSEDVVDLEDKLKNVLMLDLENRTNLVKRGKNRLALFSWDKCAREMIDAFEEIFK